MAGCGLLTLIDRKKSIFKLSQGEFVAPERLEGMLENHSNLVEQVFIYGSPLHANVVAAVVVNATALQRWWEEREGHIGELLFDNTRFTQCSDCVTMIATINQDYLML